MGKYFFINIYVNVFDDNFDHKRKVDIISGDIGVMYVGGHSYGQRLSCPWWPQLCEPVSQS